mmetsp:Transcript_22936/g.64118  ORF Transcript_22936/g.64118 Transcript_22936/m.64118 type:complete len:409 (-) Transcript_22936:1180-2406(-)
MLSTATLLSEVASNGDRSKIFDHIFMICTDTCVFPVPGGPWMTVQVRKSAASIALRWEMFSPDMARTSSWALSILPSSKPLGRCEAICTALGGFFSAPSASLSSSSAALLEPGRPPIPRLRRTSAQLSTQPTPAATSSSLTSGNVPAVAICSKAANCRSYNVRLADLSRRHRFCFASLSPNGIFPLSWTTMACALTSDTKPSPTQSSAGSCSDKLTASPRPNRRRSWSIIPGRLKAIISLPRSCHPGSTNFRPCPCSRRPKIAFTGRPCSAQPVRRRTSKDARTRRRLIDVASARNSKCKSTQKCAKYSTAAWSRCVTTPRSSPGSTRRSIAATSCHGTKGTRPLATFPVGSASTAGSACLAPLARMACQPPRGGVLASRALNAKGSVSRLAPIHQPASCAPLALLLR